MRAHDIKTEEDWLAWRAEGVTGSDISILMGENSFSDVRELYFHKKGLESKYIAPQVEAARQRGKDYEERIIDAVMEKYKLSGLFGNYPYDEADNPFYRATPDAVVWDNKLENQMLIEAKTISISQWQKNNETMLRSHYWQVQWYLFITGIEKALLSYWVFDNFNDDVIHKRTYEIDKNDDDIERACEMADIFLYYLQNDIVPPATLQGLTLEEDDIEVIGQYKRVTVLIKELQQQKDSIKQGLLERYQMGIYLDDKGNKIAKMSVTNTKRFDTPTFKKYHKTLYTKFTKESSTTRFTIT